MCRKKYEALVIQNNAVLAKPAYPPICLKAEVNEDRFHKVWHYAQWNRLTVSSPLKMLFPHSTVSKLLWRSVGSEEQKST